MADKVKERISDQKYVWLKKEQQSWRMSWGLCHWQSVCMVKEHPRICYDLSTFSGAEVACGGDSSIWLGLMIPIKVVEHFIAVLLV